MYNVNDILIDKEASSFVRIENVSNTNCRGRILAVDSTTGYPIHLTCACIDLDADTGYSVDLNCKFEPWLDTIKEESEVEKIKEIINNLNNINWQILDYEEEEEEQEEEFDDSEYESENDNINEEEKEEEIENNLYIKTLRRKLIEDSEDDDATLVPNSPKSPLVSLNSSETEISAQ